MSLGGQSDIIGLYSAKGNDITNFNISIAITDNSEAAERARYE